jgi:hypothetical protein
MDADMTGAIMKKAAIAAMLAVTVTLSACGGEADAPAPVEGVVPGIEISNARLVLPPVEGNPAAVYFDVAYTADRGISISGAEVAGAQSATVHDMMEYNFEMTMAEAGPVPLTSGTELSFEPGAMHIMAFDLGDGFEPGGTAEVTLKISGGGRHKFNAEIRTAGEER